VSAMVESDLSVGVANEGIKGSAIQLFLVELAGPICWDASSAHLLTE